MMLLCEQTDDIFKLLIVQCFYKSRLMWSNKINSWQKKRVSASYIFLTKKNNPSLKLRKRFKISFLSINSFHLNVSLNLRGLLYSSFHVSLHSQPRKKNLTLINRLLKVTLEEEMKRALLCLSFLPGEWDRNSTQTLLAGGEWKISLGLWSPRAPERANWTDRSWVMLLYIGVIPVMNGSSTASQILCQFQSIALFLTPEA